MSNRIDNRDFTIKELPRLPEEIRQAYINHNLVIFVGAGISRLMGCKGWDQMSNDLINAVCPYALAKQIIESRLDSKAKITIAERYCKKNHKEKVFWDTFYEAIKPNPKKADIYNVI